MHLNEIWNIWMAGGWVMIPLAVLSLCIYALATQLLLYFSRRGYHKVAEADWKAWVHNPNQGVGEVGEIIRYTQDDVRSLGEVHTRFAEVMAAKLPSLDRRLSTLNTLIAAAPLLGLLGTVFGMLLTFRALANGGGGEVTEAMASGISAALFPPEVGLCVALPGLMLIHVIKRKRQEYEAFIARLESLTVQMFKKRVATTGSPETASLDTASSPAAVAAAKREGAGVMAGAQMELKPTPA